MMERLGRLGAEHDGVSSKQQSAERNGASLQYAERDCTHGQKPSPQQSTHRNCITAHTSRSFLPANFATHVHPHLSGKRLLPLANRPHGNRFSHKQHHRSIGIVQTRGPPATPPSACTHYQKCAACTSTGPGPTLFASHILYVHEQVERAIPRGGTPQPKHAKHETNR